MFFNALAISPSPPQGYFQRQKTHARADIAHVQRSNQMEVSVNSAEGEVHKEKKHKKRKQKELDPKEDVDILNGAVVKTFSSNLA